MATAIELQEKKKRRDSMALSLIIHAFLLLFFLFPLFSFYSNNEPPQFQGIQVALGNPQFEERNEPPAVQETQEEEEETKPVKKSAPPKKSAPVKAEKTKAAPEKVVSKVTKEKAEVVATKEKVVATKNNKTEDAKKKVEAEKQKEAEKLKQEREAQAQAEREAQETKEAEEERKRAEAAKKKADAKKKFQGLMNNSSSTSPSAGQENGKPNAEALEGLTTGKGKVGTGLGNREVLYAPQIKDNSQSTGKVVVNICVNSAGKVVKATFTQKGSTTTDSNLIDLAIGGAKKYEFSASKADEQCGDILIDFKLK